VLNHSVSRSVQTRLRELERTLPPGSVFRFHETDPDEECWDGLSLDMLSLPAGARQTGIATGFLAEVLVVTDDFGITTAIDADPTRKRGDPSLFDLARWYCRFGFEMKCLTQEGRLHMQRKPGGPGLGVAAILDAYAKAKAARDLTREKFEGWIDLFVSVDSCGYGEEWARQFRARGN
jgi:hypothetical protein